MSWRLCIFSNMMAVFEQQSVQFSCFICQHVQLVGAVPVCFGSADLCRCCSSHILHPCPLRSPHMGWVVIQMFVSFLVFPFRLYLDEHLMNHNYLKKKKKPFLYFKSNQFTRVRSFSRFLACFCLLKCRHVKSLKYFGVIWTLKCCKSTSAKLEVKPICLRVCCGAENAVSWTAWVSWSHVFVWKQRANKS